MPAFSLGKEERSKLPPSYSPGPAAYQKQASTEKPIGYNISKAIIQNSLERHNLMLDISNQAKIAAKSILLNRNPKPGPDCYNIPPSIQCPQKLKQWKMGMRTNKDRQSNVTPGPGAYTSKGTKSNCSFSFGYKFDDEDLGIKKPNNIGPGAYDIPLFLSKKENK